MRRLRAKQLNKKIVALFVLVATIFSLCLFIPKIPFSNYAFAEVALKDKYVVGEVLEFPKMSLEYGDMQYKTETVLYYPNGDVKKCSNVRFASAGKYTLEYRREVNGRLLKKSYDFTVSDFTYTINGSSQAEYKTDDSDYDTGLSGLWLNLSNGGKFEYNKVIDLRDLQEGEEAIKLFLLPNKPGYRDLTDLTITFTDAYDASNQVIVQINCVHNKGAQIVGDTWLGNGTGTTSTWQRQAAMYFVGTTPGSMYSFRYDAGTGGVYEASDTWYRYGYETQFSFNAQGVHPVGEEFLTVGFDLDKKWVLGADNGEAANRMGMENPLLVADLSDDMVYPQAWKGFTTGEVYVSITGSGYLNTHAGMMITKLGKEDLSKELYEGTMKPDVFVDLQDYNEKSIPLAEVGKAYPLFKATARDYFNGQYAITPRVFYQYDYETTWEMMVENGTFTPDRAGVYTLVYTTKDGFGQTTSKRVDVLAVGEVPALTAEFDADYVTESPNGVQIDLPTVTANGGSGNKQTKISVSLGDQTWEVTGGVFKPVKIGEYTIQYTVTDYLGKTETLSYQLNVIANTQPVQESEIVLPKYFIDGKMYLLPDCSFVNYATDNGSSIVPTIKITDADGENTLASNREYIVKAGSRNKIKVEYSAEMGGNSFVLFSQEVPVKRIAIEQVSLGGGEIQERLDLSSYFATTGGITSTMGNNGVELEGKIDGTFEFIKPVLAETLNVKLQIDKEKNNYNAIGFYLTDSENFEQSISLRFQRLSSGKINAYLNGKKLSGSLKATFDNGGIIMIAYAAGVLTVNSTELRVPLRNYANGEAFEGFASGKVYFGGEMSEVGGKSLLRITKVNNQTMGMLLEDDVNKPEIAVRNSYKLAYNPNDKVTILDVVGESVLNTYVDITLRVTGPDKKVMTAEDGTVLNKVAVSDYVICLKDYGDYRIIYTATDESGKTASITIPIGVYDFVKPEIILEGKVPTSATVGSTISLPNATVKDNCSADKDIRFSVQVVAPNGTVRPYDKKMTYTTAGTWTIRYVAYDEVGNMQLLTYKVVVK